MRLNEEIWYEIDTTLKLSEEVKKSLHVRIMRVIEQANATPVGKKLGATVYTEECSMAGNKTSTNRNDKPLPGDPRPKSL